MQLFTDADLERLATPSMARVAMRDALVASWRRELVTPPRVQAMVGDRNLAFSCGARTGHWVGYRSSVVPGAGADHHVVTVMDAMTNQARAVAVGRTLGPRRSGAIGAVALEALGPVSPQRIGMVGTGVQAWHQLWALPEWFRAVPISVYSRTRSRLIDFADRARSQLGLDVRCADSADNAVRGADCVILATTATRPVIKASSLNDAKFVTVLGPKARRRSEFDPEWFRRLWTLTTDSPTQLNNLDPDPMLATTGVSDAISHLGAVLTGEVRPFGQRRAFFSVGLAGTEPWLLDALAGEQR